MGLGKNIVVLLCLYGGMIIQFSQIIKCFGWFVIFVDFDDLDVVKVVINDDICVVFCEVIVNFGGYIIDLDVILVILDVVGILLIVDNIMVIFYLCCLIEYGVILVVYLIIKYLIGNGIVIGGCVVDLGKFDWFVSDKFLLFLVEELVYYGLKFYEVFGLMVFMFYSIVVGLCDLGMMMNLQVVYYMLMGIEILLLCMDCYVENVQKVVEWFENDLCIEYVIYVGLDLFLYKDCVVKICFKGVGGLFIFVVKGGYDVCVKLVDSFELFSYVVNLGDMWLLIIYLVLMIYCQLILEQ